MAKKQTPFPQTSPSTEAENQKSPVEPLDPTTVEVANRAFTDTSGYQEISARGDDHYYAQHWGINE